jgi:amidase
VTNQTKSDDVGFFDATAQAELVRRRELEPIDLLDAAIERIERLNPAINAVVARAYEEARKTACRALPDGPLKGVPFLLKDLVAACAGMPTTSGSAFLRDFVPDRDSVIVQRLKQAGIIILGKANTSEFGTLPTAEPHLFGPCRNPWNTNLSAGGSSGGSAAAVAAHMIPAAHANDGGGSLRIPSSCCGVFGLKPTRARNPLGPDFGDIFAGIVVEHAITRSVRDSAALLDATWGPDTGDPYWAPPPERPFLQEVGADPGTLRIAFTCEKSDGVPLHPDCVAATRDAAILCTDLGHEVTEAALPVDSEMIRQCFTTLWSASCVLMIDGLAKATGRTPNEESFEPTTWALYEIGCRHSASDYLTALQSLQRLCREISRLSVDYDLWLTPTLGEPPLPLGAFEGTRDDPLRELPRIAQFIPFASVYNFTGQPAMSVPLFWNSDGLPIGVQFAARFGDEATLFRLAAQLEEARPWAERRPPVSA